MYIDTHSKESMEKSVCEILKITPSELYTNLSKMGEDNTGDYDGYVCDLESFISQHYQKGTIDKVLFFHLSRRLKGTENDTDGQNLLNLLTTENAFSSMLCKHGIVFSKGENHIDVFHNGMLVDWDKCWNGNSSYMKSRLGYFKGREDYCFNGFAFKDILYKNSYARNLSGVPEFLGGLIECLNRKDIGSSYMKNSSYYCYEYCIPISRVLLDGHDNYSDYLKELYLIKSVILRLDCYTSSNVRFMIDDDNPILRLRDNDNLESEYFISKEHITWEMLCEN